MEKINILTANEIQEKYGIKRTYVYKLLNTPGCPVLPRSKNEEFHVIDELFREWLMSHHTKK